METDEVLAKLLDLGCETGQGFIFGAPDAKVERHISEVAAKLSREVA